MDPLPRIADRMHEADQHLDRLGSILRSLRAPPERALGSSLKPRRAHQPHHQQQQQQQQQGAAGFLHHSGPSSRSFTKPKTSQPEAFQTRRTRSAKTDRRNVNVAPYEYHRDRTSSSSRPATSAPPATAEENIQATRGTSSHAREQERSPRLNHLPPPPPAAVGLSADATS
ncbi:unnamed protein product, partial [Laminaria digitata]